MQNKHILSLILANILWSLIPVIVIGLFRELSIITIIFLRFFVSGIILFALAILYTIINNKYTSNEPISIKELFKFIVSKNESFFNMRFVFYCAIIGFFGIVLQIIFFFLALKITTISLTMVGFQLSIIFIVLYEHGSQSERLDIFKGLYILILFFSIGIIVIIKAQESSATNTAFSILGFFYIIFFTITLFFLQITIDRDSYSKNEIILINRNPNYKIPRLLIKISLTFFCGITLMFPFIFILIPFQTSLTPEIIQFFVDLPIIFQILLKWEIIFLILFATIIPYVLLFFAYTNWNPYNLSYRQWNSILNIIEPLGGLLFGVLFMVDTFPIGYLIIIIFLLTISILLRYIHESTNKVNAYLLLKQKRGNLTGLTLDILKFNGVNSIHALIGIHDMLVNVKTNSLRDFYSLVDEKLRKIEEIKSIKILFINKINKFTT